MCTLAAPPSLPQRLYSIAGHHQRNLLLMKINTRLRAYVSRTSYEAGFTLMELMIVMSIMLIIMAFAVPQLMKVKKNANQTSALQSIRVINSAEFQYNAAYQTFGCPLSLLGGDSKAGAPTAEGAQLLDPTLAASGHKSGYIFTLRCGSKATITN